MMEMFMILRDSPVEILTFVSVTGTDSARGVVCKAEMYKRRSVFRGRSSQALILWRQQTRGEKGLPNSKIYFTVKKLLPKFHFWGSYTNL